MLPNNEKKLIEYLYAAKKIIDSACLDCDAKCNPICLWHQLKAMLTLIFKAAAEKEKQRDIIEGLF